MPLGAAIVWSATAGLGLCLLAIRLLRRGIQRKSQVTRFPAALHVSHPVLALTGLGLWYGYLAVDDDVFAWAAFGAVSVSALLGFALLTQWLTGIGGRHARAGSDFPAWLVALHACGGLATFVLVLITASVSNRG